MGLIFIAFEGYEIIVQTREEIIAPAPLSCAARSVVARYGIGWRCRACDPVVRFESCQLGLRCRMGRDRILVRTTRAWNR